MRVLLVDDSESVRRGLRALLKGLDQLTLCGEAHTGREAIEMGKTLKPDVVIIDLSLPDMNGIEVTRELRRTLPDARIAVFSQHDLPALAAEALKAGANTYIAKSSVWNLRAFLRETTPVG